MSIGGMLAAGVAGGAKAYGDQLTKDIAAQTEGDLFKTKADIMEQSRMRELEFMQQRAQQNKLWETSGAGGEAILGFERRKGAQQAETDVAKAGMLATAGREAVKAGAADPEYMRAARAELLNDPRVQAQVAASMAAAGASAQHTALLKEQLSQTVQVGKVAETVRGLQAKLAATTDEAERTAIQQQITDTGFTGKDPTRFLSLAEKAQDNARDAIKILADPTASPASIEAATRALGKASDLSEQAAKAGGIKLKEPAKPTEAQAQLEAVAAIKAGRPAAAVNAQLVQMGYAALPDKVVKTSGGGGMLNARAPTEGGISYQTNPYGGQYFYRGKAYSSLADAQAAKDAWQKDWDARTKPEDYATTPQ